MTFVAVISHIITFITGVLGSCILYANYVHLLLCYAVVLLNFTWLVIFTGLNFHVFHESSYPQTITEFYTYN